MLTLHGICLSSSPQIIAPIVVSNPAIALASFAMPAIHVATDILMRLAKRIPHHG